ncbi:tetratricopeptide repeat protein [Methylotetracoccus oryzae]|uniref:tetratricopeptide repeat protein n=1 Tax=Methylotetracoccus oryzae TaxID=1919059 RepID=UPI001118CC6F|nr:tetratricopeptide repeat protein [Methylotetracoccus oryzae]
MPRNHDPNLPRPSKLTPALPIAQRGGVWLTLLLVLLVLVAGGLAVIAYGLQQEVERQRSTAADERRRGEDLAAFILTGFADQLTPLGRIELLETPARKVLDYYASLPADAATSDTALRARSVALDLLGEALARRGDLPRSLDAYREALALAEELAARQPEDEERQRDLAVSLTKIGDAKEARGELAAARDAYGKALAIFERQAKARPEDRQVRHDQALMHERLGRVLSAQSDFPGALKAFRLRQITLLQLTNEAPDQLNWQRELGHSYGALGDLFLTQGDRPAANAAYQRYQEIAQQVVRREPDNAEWQRDLAVSFEKAGDLRAVQGDIGGARAAYQKFSEIASRLSAQDPGNLQWQRDVAAGQERVAALLAAQNKLGEAVVLQQRGADRLAVIAGKLGLPAARSEAAEAYGRLSRYLLLHRQPKEAVDAAQRGLAIDGNQTRLRLNLAHALLYSGRVAEAEQVYRQNRHAVLPGEKRFDEEALAELRDLIVKGLVPPEMAPVETWLKGGGGARKPAAD